MDVVEVYNFDGDKVTVPVRQIESVRKPSGRSRDNGGLGLLSGRTITFGSDGEAERVIRAMVQHVEEEG